VGSVFLVNVPIIIFVIAVVLIAELARSGGSCLDIIGTVW
jgi:hypothetical protein